MSEKPLHTIRAGGVKATVWQNRGEDGQPFLTTLIIRSYRDGNGNWKETNTFMPHQLPQLELAARKAYEFTQLGRETVREQSPGTASHQEPGDQQSPANDNAPPASVQAELAGMAANDNQQSFTEKVERQRGGRRR